jgi:hypothetical protein
MKFFYESVKKIDNAVFLLRSVPFQQFRQPVTQVLAAKPASQFYLEAKKLVPDTNIKCYNLVIKMK